MSLLRWLVLGWLLFAALAGAAVGKDPAEVRRYDERVKPDDRTHWAYQPVRELPVPAVKNASWLANPIDAFVLARLEAKGWRPAPPAEPRALLRRIYLDLTGLPPTPEEQEAFLRDSTPGRLDRVVRDLLA